MLSALEAYDVNSGSASTAIFNETPMNTSAYMPYKSISPNIIVCKGLESYPGLYGTGFFVTFPPFEPVFYVTARHCIVDILPDSSEAKLMIPVVPGGSKSVLFSHVLQAAADDSCDNDIEDVAIYVVSEEISTEEYVALRERALPLQHQDDVDNLLNLALARGSNLRAVGYPIHNHPNCATEVDYDAGQMRIQPRGFYGKLSVDGLFPNQYCLTEVNWKEHDYRGFSGSPVVELAENISVKGDVHPLVVGVVLMATQHLVRFISINVVCNTIAAYLVHKGYVET